MNDSPISDAVEIAHRRYYRGRAGRIASLNKERIRAGAAMLIYQFRTDNGLTQEQLASRVNTTASVISRLEDADYCGHTVKMLERIANVFGKTTRIAFVDGEYGEVPSFDVLPAGIQEGPTPGTLLSLRGAHEHSADH